jgi:hypothetical protein
MKTVSMSNGNGTDRVADVVSELDPPDGRRGRWPRRFTADDDHRPVLGVVP